MTQDEFETFWHTLRNLMPTIEGHAVRCNLVRTWEAELAELQLDDAIAALRMIARGETERPHGTDLDLLPVFVLSAASKARWARTEEQQRIEDATKLDPPTRGAVEYARMTMMQLAHEAELATKQARAAGMTDHEVRIVRRQRIAELMAGEPEDARDAVRCLDCHDIGWVTCFNLVAMEQAYKTVRHIAEFDQSRWLGMVWDYSCACAYGKEAWQRRGRQDPLPRYDQKRDVRVELGIPGLLDWATGYRRRSPFDYDPPPPPAEPKRLFAP